MPWLPEQYEHKISELNEEIWELRKENKRLRQLVYDLGGDPDEVEEIEEEECETQFVESDLSLEEMKEMVEIEPCTFQIGALDDDEDADDDEKPRHEVKLTRSFSVGKYQVTQALWESVMGNNPSDFKGSSRPVDSVNWLDCVLFCNKLSEKEGLDKVYTLPDEVEQALKNQSSYKDDKVDKLSKEVSQNLDAKGYRLPTEAEWECAARGGEYHLYAGSNDLDEVAWTDEKPHGVGQKKPNGFGLYDMSGNVDEWCWDWWDDDTEDYSNASSEDPTGASEGSDRVSRGGSWFNVA